LDPQVHKALLEQMVLLDPQVLQGLPELTGQPVLQEPQVHRAQQVQLELQGLPELTGQPAPQVQLVLPDLLVPKVIQAIQDHKVFKAFLEPLGLLDPQAVQVL
jgi:hypothetical protein